MAEGTLHVRYFIGETINTRACGCRHGDAGEYRFWNAWGLKVPKTCTPPRPPGHAGDYRTCAVFVWREGTLHVRYFLGETINKRACGCRPGDAGEYRFWSAWGLKVPKTCTPPRPPGHAGDYRTCAVFCMAGRSPTRSLLHRRNNQYAGLRVPARGRGGVQVLERLGPESAQNLHSPAPPGRGLQNLCCLCMAGRNPTRSLLHRRNNQYAGLRVPARDAGEYRFWNAWGLKVPKTCTPPRPPGHAGDYRTCAVFVWREGTLHVRYFIGETINTWACGSRPGDAGGVQVLERLGPESAQNLYSPAPPGPCRGLQNLCCFCMAEGTLHVRYFIGETINTRACGCRPGDAGEYRFWNAWGLKVPKTCTPPRPPAMQGTTELVLSLYGGKEPYTFVTS